jgi:hypothetical protein
VKLRGGNPLFAVASEKLLPHAARALGFKSAYPEYSSEGGRGGAVGAVGAAGHSEL